MSHLSKIKTKIQDLNLLKKTLTDLKIQWYLKYNITNQHENKNIIVESNNNKIELIWNGQEYELTVDIELWQETIPINNFIEKINKQYSYNKIIKESEKQGFLKTNEITCSNGNVKVTFEKWINK